MIRTALISAAVVLAAGSASAQDPLTNARNAAKKAAAATNAHIEAEQRPEAQTPAAGPKSVASTPAPRNRESSATARTGGVQRSGGEIAVASDTTGPPPSILREVFAYSHDGRRDPFNSLLTTSELRPTLSDLRLVAILVDHTGGHSIATLRDIGTNAQYRVTTGATLGRMRVAAIRLMSVVFTIDEFGTTRQDSLILRDTTKVRRP